LVILAAMLNDASGDLGTMNPTNNSLAMTVG
jgi:hypothetical protein